MILLDTSVWIEYFKRNRDFTEVIDDLLRNKQVVVLDLIFGELLQGAREYEKNRIVILWELLPKIEVKESGFQAGIFSYQNKLKDKGIGLIDCAIICATMTTNCKLWTLDKKILSNIESTFIYQPMPFS